MCFLTSIELKPKPWQGITLSLACVIRLLSFIGRFHYNPWSLGGLTSTLHQVSALQTQTHKIYKNFASFTSSPRLNGTGNGKAPGSGKRKSQHQAKPHANHLSKPQSMDAFFFGNTSSKSKDRMSSARMIHGEVCSHLLASLESLQQAHSQFLDLLHNTSIEGLKAKIQVTDCHKRLHQLSEMVKVRYIN